MQKIEVTKRIADTGAMAIVRVKTVERGFEIAQGCLDGESTVWRSAIPFRMQVR